MRHEVAARWAAVGAMAVVMAACGNSSTTTGLSGSPVVMATVSPLTGQYAAYGIPTYEGSLAAAKVINDNGGVLGHQLKVDGIDDVSDPGDAVTAVNKEIALNNPVALVGIDGFAIKALQPIFDGHGIVGSFLGGSTAYDVITDPLLYRCNPSDSELSIAQAVAANQKGYKTAIAMNTEVNADQVGYLQKAWQAVGGSYLGSILLLNGQTSYRSEVQKAINYHPDVIFLSLDPTSASVLFANFQQADNLAIPFIGTDALGQPAFIKAVGPAVAQAHMTSVQGSNAQTPSYQAFSTAYQSVNGHAPLTNSSYAFDCTVVFALAIDLAGSSDPSKWVGDITKVTTNEIAKECIDYASCYSLLKSGKAIDYEGVSGPMDFDKNHNVHGPWDVVQATGNADDGTMVLKTITAAQIQQVIQTLGG